MNNTYNKLAHMPLLLCFLFVPPIIQAAENFHDGSSLKPIFRNPIKNSSYQKYEYSKESDPFELHEQPFEKDKSKYIIPEEIFIEMLTRYRTALPSKKEAESRIHRLVKEHPILKPTVKCLKNPALCRYIEPPSKLLLVGPSGCGKTSTAKALAKYCNKKCIFIKGASVGNTYQNSGSTLINDLFQGLMERPEHSFMIIIDECMSVAKYIDDSRDIQQNKTAIALWQAMDDCENAKHLCIIGTDNGDPEKLSPQIQTRFDFNIFTLPSAKSEDIVKAIKEWLDYSPDENHPECNDEYLYSIAKSSEHLSLRQIKTIVAKSKQLAVTESDDPYAKVTKEHLTYIFNQHKKPNWLEKIWINRENNINNLMSIRSICLSMTLISIYLHVYTNYKNHALALNLIAPALYHYWPKDEKESNDLALFGLLNHISTQYQNYSQWQTSHNLTEQNMSDTKKMHDKAEHRANEQYSKAEQHTAKQEALNQRAEERAEEQRRMNLEAEKRAQKTHQWAESDRMEKLKRDYQQSLASHNTTSKASGLTTRSSPKDCRYLSKP